MAHLASIRHASQQLYLNSLNAYFQQPFVVGIAISTLQCRKLRTRELSRDIIYSQQSYPRVDWSAAGLYWCGGKGSQGSCYLPMHLALQTAGA